MCEADAQSAVGYDFRQSGWDGEGPSPGSGFARVCGRVGGERDVEVAFDELEIWGEAAEVVVDGGGGEVA